MMTKDELKQKVNELSTMLTYPALDLLHAIDDHDAEQRAVIDGLSKKAARLTAWYDKVVGTLCEEIRHQQVVAGLEEKIEQQEKEIGHLTQQLEIVLACQDNQASIIEQREAENRSLREALQLLYDCQNGCPLPKYETDWHRAMELAQQALKEVV